MAKKLKIVLAVLALIITICIAALAFTTVTKANLASGTKKEFAFNMIYILALFTVLIWAYIGMSGVKSRRLITTLIFVYPILAFVYIFLFSVVTT